MNVDVHVIKLPEGGVISVKYKCLIVIWKTINDYNILNK